MSSSISQGLWTPFSSVAALRMAKPARRIELRQQFSNFSDTLLYLSYADLKGVGQDFRKKTSTGWGCYEKKPRRTFIYPWNHRFVLRQWHIAKVASSVMYSTYKQRPVTGWGGGHVNDGRDIIVGDRWGTPAYSGFFFNYLIVAPVCRSFLKSQITHLSSSN